MTNLLDLSPALWQALFLTLGLATCTTLILLVICIPLANWLNTRQGQWVLLLETLLTLPIVLPPTVIGFYLLLAMSPQYGIGQWWLTHVGQSLSFSFVGLVVGSVIYSLPFALQPIQNGFRQVPKLLLEGSAALGAKPRQTFWRIVLPSARGGVIAGASLSFAHTLGEFGVVLMLGGNIPGETRVASIALFDEVQQLNYASAHTYSLLLLIISFTLLLLITWLQRQHLQRIRY